MFRERTYRLRPLYLMVLITTGAVFGYVIVQSWLNHGPVDPPGVRAMLALAALTVAVAYAFRAVFEVHIGPEGLRTTDGVGRYHDVRWGEMRSARNLLGFLYVPHGHPGAALCFTAFLEDARGFREDVLAHAPEGNPLRAYFVAR